jgi:hypothetical protein
MKGCRTRSVHAGIPTQSVGTRTFSFPRSAWECLLGRSASGKCQSSSRLSLLSFSLQDAERPCRHSHAERGNENVLVPTLRVGMPARTLRVLQVSNPMKIYKSFRSRYILYSQPLYISIHKEQYYIY